MYIDCAYAQLNVQGISGVKLRQELQVESEQRPFMRYTELLELIKTRCVCTHETLSTDITVMTGVW